VLFPLQAKLKTVVSAAALSQTRNSKTSVESLLMLVIWSLPARYCGWPPASILPPM
jgi:hypothetical protein